MGVSPFGSSCRVDTRSAPPPAYVVNNRPVSTKPNPNPWRFKILLERHYRNAHVLLVEYPDCTTFEGMKLMVFKGRYKRPLAIDPHFSDEEGDYAPVARFEPTMEGWHWANNFACKL